MQDLSGKTVKGYDLLERLGAGGHGAVYRARQATIGREVAVKIILPDLANQPDFIRRFELEAQLVARLEHLHVVPLYDYWRDPSGAYLVMRWLRGGSLRDALEEGPLDLDQAALMLDQVAAGLEAAHNQQIVHRDIKPSNILLDEEGNAYLADFGIAKDLSGVDGSVTEGQAIIGSFDYLAPEQAKGEPVTPSTDIYELGITFYEALTGQHPFPDSTSIERLYQHINDPLPLIEVLEPGVVEGINEVIQKATAKDPGQRFQDVLEMAAAFREAANLGVDTDGAVPYEALTLREQEILRLIVDGRSNKEIADSLVVELSTIKWHITKIYRKLRVRSRLQAIVRARELDLFGAAKNHMQAAGGKTSSISIAPPEPTNPYKGLRPFGAADSRDFFGREALIQKLLDRLGEKGVKSRFVAVVGPSGSGKSSLVSAGLIPALWSGKLPGSDSWFAVEMVPGTRPLDELEVALTRLAGEQAGNLHEQLARDENGLLRAASLVLPNGNSELVLVIDQFEELFTLSADEAARAQFLDLIHAAANDGRSRVRVIITLRADFYDRPLQYPSFGQLVRNGMETLLPLTADELERAIVQPAAQEGVTFEPGLAATIIEEVLYQPGALPLLQYALTELFEQRDGLLLTQQAYEAIDGVVGALARQAEEIYQGFNGRGQEAARQMFLRLVTLGEGDSDDGASPDTRRRVLRSELMAVADDDELMDELIDTYAAYRLLSLSYDPSSRAPTVELAHEAILHVWERLHEWLDESRHDIQLERQLADAAAAWREADEDASYLLTGSRLMQYEQWRADTDLALTPLEHDYLDESLTEREWREAEDLARQAHEEALERRSRTVLWALVGVFALATVIAAGLTVFAFNQADNAQRNFVRAERIRLAAQAQIALDRGEDVIIPALLALRSLQLGYSPEADAALLNALSRSFVLQRFSGHTDTIASATFSPDGRYVLTTANDSTARLWNVQNGDVVRIFSGHSDLVRVGRFSPNGEMVLTAGADGTVRMWDAESGEEISRLPDHDSPVWAMAVSLDGDYILTADESGSAFLWDAHDQQLVHRLSGHGDTVLSGSFSPNGRYAVTTSLDRTARLWAVATGQEIRTFEGHAAAVNDAYFSPDGRFLLTASNDNTARLWNVETGEEVRQFIGHTNSVDAASISPDGRYGLTVSRDKTGRLWDLETGEEVRQFIGHTTMVNSAEFSPDGQYVLTGGAVAARLWSVQLIREPRVFAPPFRTIHSSDIVLLSVSSDGRQVFTGSGDGTVRLWDAEDGQIVEEGRFDVAGLITDLAFSPDGMLALTSKGDGNLLLWDATTGREVFPLVGHTDAVWDIGFSADGSHILTASSDGTARVWDVLTGAEIRQFTGHAGRLRSAAFSLDGHHAVTGGDDATVRLWDARTGEEVAQFLGHTAPVLDVAISPDGRWVLSGGEDGTARLWDAQTGQEVRRFVGHNESVWAVAFSPDGRYVLTGSDDRTARMWNRETGQIVRQLVGHASPIRSVGFSSDGRFILTGDLNSGYLWRTELEEVIGFACEQLTRDFTIEERTLYSITEDAPTCAES